MSIIRFICICLCIALSGSGLFAQSLIEDLEQKLKKEEHAEKRLELELELVTEKRRSGDTLYHQQLDRLIQAAKDAERYDLMIRGQLEQGLYLELHDDIAQAEEIYLNVLSSAKKHGLKESQGQAYYFIGNKARYSGQYDEASSYYDSAMHRFTEIQDTMMMASVLFSQGVISDYEGHLERSTEQFFASLDMARSIGDSSQMANCHNSLGILHIRTKEYAKAESQYRKALGIMKSMGQMTDVANITDNIGEVLRYQGKIDSALHYGEEALRIRRQLDDQRGIARGLMNLALTQVEAEQYEAAEAGLLASRAILESRGDEHSLIGCLNRLATVYQRQGDESEAIRTAENALRLSQKLGSGYQEKSVQRNLSYLHEQMGHYRPALEHYQAYDRLKDSLLNAENKAYLNELETRYETAEKDRQLAVQQGALAEQESALQRRNLWIALISGASLLLLLFLWTQNRSIKQKRKIEQAEREQLLAERKIGYAEAMLNGQERERGRIAKDLHDGLGALLATAKMHLSQVQEGIEQLEKLKVSEKASELLDTAYAEVRRISHDMMPASLEKFGLEKALASLVSNMKSTGLQAELLGGLGEERLASDLEFALYRIAQEAANNTLKYAEADSFTIQLERATDRVQMLIRDDGKGFDMAKTSSQGLGLENMRSRAGFFDGKVEIVSSLGAGTQIIVDIPLDHG